MKKFIIIIFFCSFYLSYAQQVTQAEYFFDIDPGFGSGTSITIAPSNDIQIDQMLNISGLSPGFHTAFFRVKDNSNNWSPVLSKLFYIENGFGELATVLNAEYFFDTDPGYGQGISLTITQGQEIQLDQMLDISNLTPGFHMAHVRVKDSNDSWSQVYTKPFYIEIHRGQPSLINRMEYFYDTDPGIGNGIAYTDFTPGTFISESFLAEVGGLQPGMHEFNVRVANEAGQWSQVLLQEFELLNCELTMAGSVKNAAGQLINSGTVVLYQFFGEGSAVEVATYSLQDGTYQFTTVCPNSQYFVKVIPVETDDYLPTYYGNSIYWADASIVDIQEVGVTGIEITVAEFAQITTGTSRVGGHIYMAEFRGEPVKNVDVILEYTAPDDKADYLAVAYDRSDEIGAWQIPNLPNGNYRIKVEIPGLNMDTTYYVSITTPDTYIDNLNFYIDYQTGIYIDHFGVDESLLNNRISLFPNPAVQGNFLIQSTPDIQIESIIIYKYDGQVIDQKMVHDSQYQSSGNNMSSGFYLVKIQTSQGVITKRVIIP